MYLHEKVILGQMLRELSCKQLLSLKVVLDMYVDVGGMAGGTYYRFQLHRDLFSAISVTWTDRSQQSFGTSGFSV